MKKHIYILSILISLLFTGCSVFISDLQNLTTTSTYKVVHLKEKVAEYNEEGIQINKEYEEIEVETCEGFPEELTNAVSKTYPGFYNLPFTQKTIESDGSTVIEIKYDRVETTVIINTDGGYWDYSSEKQNSNSLSFTGKFGSEIPEIDVSELGKRFCEFTGWKTDDNSIVLSLPETFPVKDETYIACWNQNGGVQYKIHYLFEPENNENAEDFAIYVYDSSKDEIQLAEAGETTEATEKTFYGFELSKPIEQKTVLEDGSTVVEIFYKRCIYSILFNTGSVEETNGIWNYSDVKNGGAEPDSEDQIITAKFGSILDYSFTSDIGLKGHTFKGWKDVISGQIVILPSNMPINGGSYIAIWEEDVPVNYTVRHLFEKIGGNPAIYDSVNYELLSSEDEVIYQAMPEEIVNISSKEVAGFTAVEESVSGEVNRDGSTVINLYYTRNTIYYIFKINEGMWNYKDWRADQAKAEKTVVPDQEDKVLSGKFGTTVDTNSLLEKAGKKSHGISSWTLELSENETISSLPANFGSTNETFIANWETATETSYIVEHWFENVDCIDSSIENDANYTINASFTENLKGIPESNTAAVAKVISGFTAKPVNQKEISAVTTVTVKIFYTRKSIDVRLNPADGIWNYDIWKSDKDNISAENSSILISGKFGTKIEYPDFNDLKKAGKILKGFMADGKEAVVVKLPETFPDSNTSFSAIWIDKAPVAYTVKHWIEKKNSTDENSNSNYEVESTDTSLKGIPEYYTEAVYKNIKGFEPREIAISQEEIAENGSTVVNLYYKRSIYKITFDANGGIWNYADYKGGADPLSENLVISGKYGTAVVLPDLTGIGKTSHNLSGWTKDTGNTVFDESKLIKEYDSTDVIYKAAWILDNGTTYSIVHYKQSVNDKNKYDEFERETAAGAKETPTEAVAKTIPGFTPQTIIQKDIAEDGSTEVIVRYDRNYSNFIFDANGGTISGEETISGLFESTFDKTKTPKAEKAGWTFAGWKLNGELVSDSNLQLSDMNFEVNDITFTAYWISTVKIGQLNTFSDINLVVENLDTKYIFSVTLPEGYESKKWTYKWYIDGIYVTDTVKLERTNEVLGRGKHTITIKTAYNGNNFTARKTIDIE